MAELDKMPGPRVPLDGSDSLIRDITETEIWEIIKNSPENKSPGTDGLTTEFYKHFWPQIKTHLIESYNISLKHGSLSIGQKQGIITLIPKLGKDSSLLKNWRPITLLNQDYKYLAKCLANRCRDILPGIIGDDQTGFVHGRLIGKTTPAMAN